MHMCYLDESGTVDLSDSSQTFVLLGLAIPANCWKSYEQKFAKTKQRFGLGEQEIHVAWMNRRYSEQDAIHQFETLDWSARRAEVQKVRDSIIATASSKAAKVLRKEFKATEAYIHLTRRERYGCLLALANTIGRLSGIKLFAEAVNKKFFAARCPQSPLFEFAFTELLHRYHSFLERKQQQTSGEVFGMVVQDRNDGVSKRITDLAMEYHRNGTGWTKIDRIIETPLFVDSKLTSMVQMADLCSYSLRRMIDHQDFDLFSRVWKRFDSVDGNIVGANHYAEVACKCKLCVHGCLQSRLPLARLASAVSSDSTSDNQPQ